MPETILDYIRDYGDYTFTERPMSDADSLVFCQFCYLKFDGMVPLVSENRRSVTMKQLKEHADYEKLYADSRFEKDNRALFEAMYKSKRFRSLKMNCYINIVEPEWETQFSAITFFMDDGTMYVAFRGTDETIVGWKEDFNMAFQFPVPSQEYAAKYLNMVTGKLHNRFFIGGHSKGGNVAIYAAMMCTEPVKERIIRIYCMDGPGFPKEVLSKKEYGEIEERIVKILPHSSLVGMLFETSDHYKVVESKSFGLLQHNPFSWLLEKGEFIYVKHLSVSQKKKDETLNDWVCALSREDRKVFVDTLYQVISASKAENLIDFSADLKTSMNGMIMAMKEIDPETRKTLKKIIKLLFDIALQRMAPKKSHKKMLPEKE